MKACTRCREVKPPALFNRNPRARDGLTSMCKACKIAEGKERAARNARLPIEHFAERFWAKVDKTATCWIWTGATNNKGYGHMWTNKPSPELTHHIAMRLAGLPIPSKEETDECVDHTCRNPRCCNIAHLRVVTQRQNAVENNSSPFAVNARKTHCAKGHEYTPENTAMKRGKGPKGTPTRMRICLTCYPSNWRYAIIPRTRNC